MKEILPTRGRGWASSPLFLVGNEARVLSKELVGRLNRLPLDGIVADLYACEELSRLRGYPKPMYYVTDDGRLVYRLAAFPGGEEEYLRYLTEMRESSGFKVLPSLVAKDRESLLGLLRRLKEEGFGIVEVEVLPFNEGILGELKFMDRDSLREEIIVKLNLSTLLDKGTLLLNFLNKVGVNTLTLSNTLIGRLNLREHTIVKIFLSSNDALLFYSKLAHSLGFKVIISLNSLNAVDFQRSAAYSAGFQVQYPLLMGGCNVLRSLLEQVREGPSSPLPLRLPSLTRMNTVTIDESRCDGCGICAEACPFSALKRVGSKVEVSDERCTGCGLCVGLCPRKAIKGAVYLEVSDDERQDRIGEEGYQS